MSNTAAINHKQIPKVSISSAIWSTPTLVRNPIDVFTPHFDRLKTDIFQIPLFGGLQSAVVTRDAAHIQHILQKNNRNYRKTPVQTEKLAQYLGHGLLTSQGEYWLQQRRLIQPGFHRKRLAGLAQIMSKEILDFVKRDLTQPAQIGKPFDMWKLMMELTFRVVSCSLFNSGFTPEELERIRYVIVKVQQFFVRNIRQPYLVPYFKLTGKSKHHKKLVEETDEIMMRNLQKRREEGIKYNDLLDMLLEVRYEDTGEGMTDQQLRDEALILFVAGHETSANGLTWMWYLLSQHPEVVAKVREETDRVLGDAPIGFEHLPQMPYSMQVVKETMRMYPPAWTTDRMPIEDDVVDGYPIPKDTPTLLFIYGAHHNPKYWDEPEVFKPERFSKEASAKRPKFAYLPFGGGPRLCIGQNFALMEMQMILVELLRRFDFELTREQPIELQPLVTLHPRGGMQMKIKPKQ